MSDFLVTAGTGSGDVGLCYLPTTLGPRDNSVSRDRQAPATTGEGLDPLPTQSPASKDPLGRCPGPGLWAGSGICKGVSHEKVTV